MLDLLASGRLIDGIIALVALEALLLLVLPKFLPRTPTLDKLWPNLVSGVFLLLALRFALTDAPVVWVALALLGSLVAHAIEFVRPYLRQA